MKYLAYSTLIFLLIACGNDNSVPEKQLADNPPQEKKQEQASGDGIVGEWELTGVTEDKNGNDQLDADERNIASKNMKDYMKLNSDGSAVFHTFKTKGRYEIKTNPDSGNDYLTLFDKDNFKYPKGAVMSVGKEELLIMNKFGGNSITIWKRL